MAKKLSTIFKKNRAEEFPDDLWDTFILPLEYEQWNLLENDKGVHVIGGRGTGKTMYLKYHCFPTQLSSKREVITKLDIQQIGIYWRPDTHFAQLMNSKYLKERWAAAFNTYVGLSLIMKFSKLIKKLIKSNYENQDVKNKLKELKISDILKEELQCKENILYTELFKHCDGLLLKLQNWLHNTTSKDTFIIDGKASLQYIISTIKEEKILENTTFHIFIDEFENLTTEQQIVINSWMKHGEKPLIYSIAYKKYAEISNKTSGEEQTQRRNDHRIIDIVDDVYAKDKRSFKIFASEIIANKLAIFLENNNILELSDRKNLTKRRTEKYKERMLSISKTIFPEKNYYEIADEMMNDEVIARKIQKNIAYALKLKKSSLNAKEFISENSAATLVNSILLFRTKTKPDNLLNVFKKYNETSNSKTKAILDYKELIANNIVGAILYIYTYYTQRVCPIYSGFNRFCLMSKNNLRHLLELCYQSFLELEETIINVNEFHKQLPIVPIKLQLKAAIFCSRQELETISELGSYGQDLQKIANRLGRIFYLKQRIRTQSKPENIHFSVETIALDSIDEKIKVLITQAKIWNVLQEHNVTKDTAEDIATKEYMLTPMLAPFYSITPRKIHKVPFSTNDLKIIFLESDDKFDKFYAKLIQDWKVKDKIENIQHSLFGDLY